VSVKWEDRGGVITDFTNDTAIKTNSQWARYCYDVAHQEYGAAPTAYVSVRWTFAKSGQPIRLVGGLFK